VKKESVDPLPIRHCPRPYLVIAKFHYTGPTGPDQTKSADFVRDPGLRPGSREKVRASPVGSGRARVVEFSLNRFFLIVPKPILTCIYIRRL